MPRSKNNSGGRWEQIRALWHPPDAPSNTATEITLGDLVIPVTRKDIKNIHLRVSPPDGRVRISAPRNTDIEAIRKFAASKLAWIQRHQKRIRSQRHDIVLNYVSGELHLFWGTPYTLMIMERKEPPRVIVADIILRLQVRPGADVAARRAVVEKFHRDQVQAALPPLLAKWESALGVKTERVSVRKMKTKWGSCSYRRRTIRFNSELAKKPPECLEYIVVHELVHLLEPTHNHRFKGFMDRFLPDWRDRRKLLNNRMMPVQEA